MTYNDAAVLQLTSPDVVVQLAWAREIVTEIGGASRRAVWRSVYAYAIRYLVSPKSSLDRS